MNEISQTGWVEAQWTPEQIAEAQSNLKLETKPGTTEFLAEKVLKKPARVITQEQIEAAALIEAERAALEMNRIANMTPEELKKEESLQDPFGVFED